MIRQTLYRSLTRPPTFSFTKLPMLTFRRTLILAPPALSKLFNRQLIFVVIPHQIRLVLSRVKSAQRGLS